MTREAVLPHPDARLVDAATGTVLEGSLLAGAVAAAAERYAALPPGPVLALMPTRLPAVVAYLGAFTARRPVALLDPTLPADTLADLVARYRPTVVTGVEARADAAPPPGYSRVELPGLGAAWQGDGFPDVHPDLGLLLATSGSTGSPRMVRLPRRGVLHNVAVVAETLGIDGDEVTVTSLPLYYTYGLTVLNTHLSQGATVVLDDRGLLDRGFWETVAEHKVTSLAAVPYQYEMLRRLGFDPWKYPALRTLTQAGGRLRDALVLDFHRRMSDASGQLIVMYGQTEAGRMAILPPQRLPEKLGSAGVAIPDGRFTVAPGPEGAADGIGEIHYHGPNVMLGYARAAEDLARGDELGGTLATGDIGRVDSEGFLFLSGRTRRFGKVFGVRVSLSDIERMLEHRGAVAAVAGDDRIVVWVEGAAADARAEIRRELSERIGVHASGFDVRDIPELPLLPNGKVDYQTLTELAR